MQDRDHANLDASRGVAIREFSLGKGFGEAATFFSRTVRRTNEHFPLKTNPPRRENLDDFVACNKPENRHKRKETERLHAFTYEELVKRDKASLDIFWLKDDSLEVIAAQIVEDLQAALDQFALIAADLHRPV
jgi:hypothetical protein